MSFHIKCFFGKHNWETINKISERTMLETLGGKLAEDRLHDIDYYDGKWFLRPKDGFVYEQKICLRCCAIKDEVAEYIREFNGEKIEMKFEKFQTECRQKQAKSMSKSCAADKFVRI